MAIAEPSALLGNVFLIDPQHARLLTGEARYGKKNSLLPTIGYLIIFMLCLGLGLISAIEMVQEAIVISRLNQASENIQAEIIGTRATSGRFPSFYVNYEFSLEQETNTYEQMVSRETYWRLVEGSEVTVAYLADDPTISRLSGAYTDNSARDWRILPAISLTFVGLAGLWAEIRNYARNKRLANDGKIVMGVITNAYGEQRNDGWYNINVNYRFQSPSGLELKGRGKRKDRKLHEPFLPYSGTPVAILYVHDRLFEIL